MSLVTSVEELEIQLVDCRSQCRVFLPQHADPLFLERLGSHTTPIRILCRRLHCALHLSELALVYLCRGFRWRLRSKSIRRAQLRRIARTSGRPLHRSRHRSLRRLGADRTARRFSLFATRCRLSAKTLQQMLQSYGSVEQRHPDEEHLDEQLLLTALPEVRLERVDGADHPEQIARREEILSLPERRRRRSRDSIGL